MLGKIDAPLNQKLKNVKWGEYKLGDLFEIKSSSKMFHANELEVLNEQIENSFPYVVRMTTNNGIKGYIQKEKCFLNEENTLSFAQDTFTVFYQKKKYFTGNKVKVLDPLFDNKSENVLMFITSCFQKSLQSLTWGVGSTVDSIFLTQIQLPQTSDGKIDFAFMEDFITELEAERMSELVRYLKTEGLYDYKLTSEEENALKEIESVEWKEYNLLQLFGKSTRGKRLKSEDRFVGDLPFVTAGEADTGISAFISNDVEVFSENTTTIDMFGSAKYRNYKYGADDHVAVVHTEKLQKHAAIFVTSAIHKVSYNGQFNYGRNFYAKDADELNILLPTQNGQIAYNLMQNYIKAIQKLVIKDVVLYADKKIAANPMRRTQSPRTSCTAKDARTRMCE